MATSITWLLPMNFSARLTQYRKVLGLTQQGLADAAEIHVTQIKRYESGSAQPTLEALVKLARTLHISLDELVFAENERGPRDKTRLLFEAIEQLQDDEQRIIQELLEGMILKYETKRWTRRAGKPTNTEVTS